MCIHDESVRVRCASLVCVGGEEFGQGAIVKTKPGPGERVGTQSPRYRSISDIRGLEYQRASLTRSPTLVPTAGRSHTLPPSVAATVVVVIVVVRAQLPPVTVSRVGLACSGNHCLSLLLVTPITCTYLTCCHTSLS